MKLQASPKVFTVDKAYDSVADFVATVMSPCVNSANTSLRDRFATSEVNASWYGGDCNTGADVRKRLRDGWPKGLEQMQAMLAKLDTSSLIPQDRRRRIIRGDMGDHLDIGAVYAGRFQTAWTFAKRQSAMGPQHIDILANMLCSGGDNASVLFWRGAAAIALADKLEAAGYMVRIVVGFGGNHEGNGNVSCRITVKDHDMPMDITTAASVIMPGFFRAIGHAWVVNQVADRAYGVGISADRGRIEDGEIDLSHTVTNESTALKWLTAQIDKLNESRNQDAA